jgi:hypothetical protein
MADNQALIWQRLKAVPADLIALFCLKPKTVVMTTQKGAKIKTALIGAVVIDFDGLGLGDMAVSTKLI